MSMSTFSEAPHQVKGEVSSAGYPHGELTATGSARFGFDFSRLSILPLPATVIQTRLAVNTPGDEYEQEADQVSAKVIRRSEPRLQRKCACEGTCADCQKEQSGEEHQRLQLKPVGTSGAGQTEAPPIVHDVLRSPGQPLDAATLAFMEPRVGHDFSRVRVHSGAAAEQSARDVNGHAYTAGHNIVFGYRRKPRIDAWSLPLGLGAMTSKPTVSSASLSRSREPLISLPQPSPGPLQKEK